MATESLKAESPTKVIQAAIQAKMYHPKNLSKMFICESHLRGVWSDHAHLMDKIFPSAKYTAEEKRTITDDFLRVLSILISIGWPANDLGSKFRSDFLRVDGRTDKDLPFTENQSRFLDNWAISFREKQFAFIPAVIEEWDTCHIQRIDESIRLPFSEQTDEVGEGAYGQVSKIVLPPRCLQHKPSQYDNSKPRIVACKSYRHYPNENSAETFEREVENLDILKEGFRASRRVMLYIAAVVHGDDFMILLPMAELYDLEVFLRGGWKPLADTRDSRKLYNFDKEFPLLNKDPILHSALLTELFGIASALVWLHEELRIFESPDGYLAHQDLKPENVLLTRGPKCPAGKWMLTDFGVSLFNKKTNLRETRAHSIRDVGPRLTSRANRDWILRGHGPYEPPEVDLKIVDGRMCDVWSYGCILCDVLAFACGRENGLHEFRDNVRFDGKNDFFYRAKGNSTDRTKVIDDSNTELKSEIKDWFAQYTATPTKGWIPAYVDVIQKALKPDPSKRHNMKIIMESLPRLPGATETEIRHKKMVPSKNAQSPPPVGLIQGPKPKLKEANNQIPTTGAPDPQPVSAVDLRAGPELTFPTPTLPTSTPTEGLITRGLTFDQKKQIKISVPKKVTAVELAPGGEVVAFLCGHHVYAYKTKNGSRVGELELQSNVNWTKFRIACSFLAVYGVESHQKHVHQKHVQLHNFSDANYTKKLPDTCHREEASNILLSSQGHLACIYGQYANLWFLTAGHMQELGAEGFMIKGAAFSANGKVLCFWTTGTAADHAYFYDVSGTSAKLSGTGIYEKTSQPPPSLTLWPYTSIPACVIRESQGSTSVVQLHSQRHSKPDIRKHIGTDCALKGFVAQDSVLICIEERTWPRSERDIFEYALSCDSGSHQVSQRKHKVGTVGNMVDDRTSVAVRSAEGRLIVTLCTPKGHILQCMGVC